MIMDDLRQLLRYEIPGLITIMAFLSFSCPILLIRLDQTKIGISDIGKLLPGLTVMIAILALPIGVLLYQLYIFTERDNHLKCREGMNVVPRILRKYTFFRKEDILLTKAIEWWETHDHPAERNEILDVIFYVTKGENNVINLMERFQSFYHSRRVIGLYAPLVAALMTEIVKVFLLAFSFKFIFGVIIVSSFILVLKLECIWKYVDNLSWPLYCLSHYVIIGIPVAFILLTNTHLESDEVLREIVLALLIPVISMILILPTRKNGSLRREMDELESNVLQTRKDKIVEFMREKIELEQ